MKLVSAAKLRKAHEIAWGSRAFLREIEGILAISLPFLPASYSNPLIAQTTPLPQEQPTSDLPGKKVIVIAGERGLCGAYNTNILKFANREHTHAAGPKPTFVTIGRRASAFARRANWEVSASFESLAEDASLWPIDEILAPILAEFIEGKLSEVVIYYTEFVSALTQQVKCEPLLPLSLASLEAGILDVGSTERDEQTSSYSADLELKDRVPYCRFYPSAEKVFTMAVPLYLRSKLLQAALESKASEHASRMTAMDSATNNADDLIEKLRLFYNRARQATITRELIDIVGGAEAIK